jgi:predicted dehydrogenase
MMMNYGDMIRADILTNHCHRFGLSHQHAYVKLEGTKGAIIIKLGVLLDYPHGQPDSFEYVVLEEGRDPEWKTIPVEGTWFPHAFIGSMEQVMQAAAGNIPMPDNSVEDCIQTMGCVEAAYQSSREGGVPPMLQ